MGIRVLVIDDSATMRALIRAMLDREPDIEVIGEAADAMEGRALMKARNPDVVTLDIEMPGMNGLEFLEKIMRLRPTPVIIVSSLTQEGTNATMRALELGAVDCYAKPTGSTGEMLNDQGKLADLVRRAATATIARSFQVEPVIDRAAQILESSERIDNGIIAIGASTGGVEALHHVLKRFPANCPPTVIVQHINGQFAAAMARRLDEQCAPTIRLAEGDTALKPGHVYIAPGNERHLSVRAGSDGKVYSRLRPGDLVSGHRPSIDMLFNSVARELPGKAVGVLLTGMGADGAHGLLAMRNAGCPTIAQDQATCVVYGMPKVAAEIGAAKFVLGLPRIAEKALGLVA
ncbi:MAG: chemotaxis response regulator protein-glutamate methylesterase [Sphingobium sp.]|nr:chemotaxis response regulator protein-glutamate methylesterase [Sphingobium sp.]